MVSYRSLAAPGQRDGRARYYARIGLSDASPLVPNLLHALFSGRLCEIRPKKSTYADCYLWEAEHLQAREPLFRLLPHLRLKRRHAELALALMDLVEQQSVGRSMSKAVGCEARRGEAPPIRGSGASQFRSPSPKISCRGAAACPSRLIRVFAAIRRASSRVSRFMVCRRLGSSSKIDQRLIRDHERFRVLDDRPGGAKRGLGAIA
jgi:hypothetical protein